MKYTTILKPASAEAMRAFAHKHALTEQLTKAHEHPQEDYLSVSDTHPIFVVADGVTLDFRKLSQEKRPYPNPSPSGAVAKLFCESVIVQGEELYASKSENIVSEVFQAGNAKVKEYLDALGPTDISGNITGRYAATGSLMVIQGTSAHWATICDAFVAHFDASMKLTFMSSGVCAPYAVINGEVRMSEHLETGTFTLSEGDRVFLFTDGFEQHMKNPEFQDLFRTWDDTLEKRIEALSDTLNLSDPARYGHERSLIAICI